MNIELVEKAFVLAKANPQLHDQGDYARATPCGTAMCLAGWICVADGWKVDENAVARKGTRTELVSSLAEELAGLEEADGDKLFVDSAQDDMPALEERWERMKEEAAA